MSTCTAYIDGGSRGNPGVAGYGVLVLDENGQTIAELAGHLGIQTNNFAEYSALLVALEFARSHQIQGLRVFADSELLVKQVKGVYRVKNPGLKALHSKAKQLISTLRSFSIHHLPREKNQEADRLANLGMDQDEPRDRPHPATPARTLEILALFEQGIFRPLEPVSLQDKTRVRLRVAPEEKAPKFNQK